MSSRAMTMTDVLMVLATLMILAAIFFSAVMRQEPEGRTPRIQCVNNLKQVGLAAIIWSGDNNGKYPFQIAATNIGTRDFITGPNEWRHFQIMSNELSTPKVLTCPADSDRPLAATNFTWIANSNLSFFLGVDVDQTNAQMFFAGDRNITNGTLLKNSILTLTRNQNSGWTAAMHNKVGNFVLGDGSVQQTSVTGLRSAVENSGAFTNRLQMPILNP